MGRSIGGHQLPNRGQTDEWLTPPEIVKALGPFDLDPCSPISRPWDTATKHYTIEDNGLMQPWEGVVWLNPPYGQQTGIWLRRLSEHGNGIALVFARTETAMFFESVWPKASGVLFIKGRLSFYDVTGKKGRTNAGGPSVLISYDKDKEIHRYDGTNLCPNYNRLLRCGIEGTAFSWHHEIFRSESTPRPPDLFSERAYDMSEIRVGGFCSKSWGGRSNRTKWSVR